MGRVKKEAFLPQRADADSTKIRSSFMEKSVNFYGCVDPDSIGNLDNLERGPRSTLPLTKTEEEIDRMHEYNKLMGHRK